MSIGKTNSLTPSNPVTALVGLELSSVALCNEGANSRADIILTKRKEKATMHKTYEELLKALQPEDAEMLTKHVEDITAKANEAVTKATGENQKLTAELEELTKKVDELEKSKEATPANEDSVLKGVSSEVAELFKKQQATIDGLLADRADALAKARFEKCKAIPADEAELKEVLKTASPKVVELLEKAAAAIEKTVHTAAGTDGNPQFVGKTSDDYYSVLEKSAKELMKSSGGMTFEVAFAEACTRDPETYRKYTEGV